MEGNETGRGQVLTRGQKVTFTRETAIIQSTTLTQMDGWMDGTTGGKGRRGRDGSVVWGEGGRERGDGRVMWGEREGEGKGRWKCSVGREGGRERGSVRDDVIAKRRPTDHAFSTKRKPRMEVRSIYKQLARLDHRYLNRSNNK